jgi:hypothetical protein
VDDPPAVRVAYRLQDAHEDARALLERVETVGLPVPSLEKVDDRLEGPALDVLHHEVVTPALVDPHVVDGHDVRVLEAADRPDFLCEAHEDLLPLHVRQQPLDRDGPPDVVVHGRDHLAHAAGPEELALLVAHDGAGIDGRSPLARLQSRQNRQPPAPAGHRDGRGARGRRACRFSIHGEGVPAVIPGCRWAFRPALRLGCHVVALHDNDERVIVPDERSFRSRVRASSYEFFAAFARSSGKLLIRLCCNLGPVRL